MTRRHLRDIMAGGVYGFLAYSLVVGLAFFVAFAWFQITTDMMLHEMNSRGVTENSNND